jgi:alpha-N-acetylglucosamine transferase
MCLQILVSVLFEARGLYKPSTSRRGVNAIAIPPKADKENRSQSGPAECSMQLMISLWVSTPTRHKMKIATFNVNDVKKRLPNLLDWMRRARPDVACLQELKVADTEFPIAPIKKGGYGAVWRGQKSWNGLPVLSADLPYVFSIHAKPRFGMRLYWQ